MSAGQPRPRANLQARKRRPGGKSGQRSTLRAAQLSIGSFLRATREFHKLTQAEVAERTRQSPWQVSRAAVSAIERGQNFPGLEAMLALSSVLHIDPKELIERARLTAVPVDVPGVPDQELERRASEYFWAGDFKHALSIYDAMLQKLALEAPGEPDRSATRLALLEVRRATTLKRVGALLSAIASAERAISLSTRLPAVQAEAYVVLASLHCQRGHLPLASDAALRAIELSRHASPQTRGWAWMVKARVFYLSAQFEEARQAYVEAREQLQAGGDRLHRTHIEGDIGMCWMAQGNRTEARRWIERAVERARENRQPALEASWLVELGKIAFEDERLEEAAVLARGALRIAARLEHRLTEFRAEWLRHRLILRKRPESSDRQRMSHLRRLYEHLDAHEGIEEIKEFRDTVLRAPGMDDGKEAHATD